VAVQNTVALAFFVGNLSSYLLQALRQQFPEAGILDLKSYYRGRWYALETLKCLPDFAGDIVCSGILDKVCRLRLIVQWKMFCKFMQVYAKPCSMGSREIHGIHYGKKQ
jgi:hypothetical protein